MIANAYAFFKNKNLCLGSPAEITAKCLGISRNQVIKYKNFTDASARKIKRKRPKKQHLTWIQTSNEKFVLYCTIWCKTEFM
ncbi:hypothetical protein Zmor_005930 [Zophobas morio]|uniref:Uncharacterized protein n=1 Tax=Zophobas morio TaxID=2755281 RepID=A0AA38MN47_9CUCU|nr:hypothetical protein Zmor_005930 [Zophobas morio]